MECSETISQIHRSVYGTEPDVIAYAPGRIEVLGNHTDYNDGTVLSAAIDMRSYFAISKDTQRNTQNSISEGELQESEREQEQRPWVKLYAANNSENDRFAEFDPCTPNPLSHSQWANYVKGVLYYIREYMQEQGRPIDNSTWSCSIYGNVPLGAGLSSSAALEVSVGLAAQSMLGIQIDSQRLALLCQASEHNFVGSMAGLLDQFSSIYGAEHCLIHSDFRTMEVRTVPVPDTIGFLMFRSNVVHKHSESPYNERRRSCEQARNALLALIAPTHADSFALRDVDIQTFHALKDNLPSEPAQRAEHVIGEIDRVERGCEFVAQNNIEAFGELMYQSHASSQSIFENSSPELDAIVSACKKAGSLGARLSGGGWGGSVVAMVLKQDAERIEKLVTDYCTGFELESRLVHPSSGAGILKTVLRSPENSSSTFPKTPKNQSRYK